MTMRLLMFYDGRDHSREALKIVKTRAKALKAKVHVLSSIHCWGEPREKVIHEIRNDLCFVKDILGKENIPCCTHLRLKWRNPGDDIIDVAGKYRVDEIIIGTNKKSTVARYRHDWFIDHVIERTTCPVLLV
jgi:nucleotide-binding universal stress UspA family protein